MSLLVDTIFTYHRFPFPLQGVVYIIPRRLACACIRHTPSLHPHFTPTPPFPFTTPLCHAILQHHLARVDLSVFSQTKFLLRRKCTVLASLKSKTKLMIKGNVSFFPTAPGLEFPPGRLFQHTARGLFHLLDIHFTPQASLPQVSFGPSMPNDSLLPLCKMVAAVQREQAWKQQVRKEKSRERFKIGRDLFESLPSNSKCF